MLVNNRTPRARALGNELRKARTEHEYGLRQFAKSLGRDPSLVSRWETGDRAPGPVEVAQILGALGVNGKRYREIMELAQRSDDARWFATTLPEQKAQLAALVDFERTASVITWVEPLVVPGLLQTSDYARAVMIGAGVPADEIGTRVAVRMGRREILTRPDPVRLLALIGEAALRQLVGSPEIMVAQLAQLLEMADWPNVEIRVVPYDGGWHPGLQGAFLLIDSETESSKVHLELHDSGLFLHLQEEVAAYRTNADKVAARALSAEDSLALLALAKAGWEFA